MRKILYGFSCTDLFSEAEKVSDTLVDKLSSMADWLLPLLLVIYGLGVLIFASNEKRKPMFIGGIVTACIAWIVIKFAANGDLIINTLKSLTNL